MLARRPSALRFRVPFHSTFYHPNLMSDVGYGSKADIWENLAGTPNVLPLNCGLFYRHAELNGRAYQYLWNSDL